MAGESQALSLQPQLYPGEPPTSSLNSLEQRHRIRFTLAQNTHEWSHTGRRPVAIVNFPHARRLCPWKANTPVLVLRSLQRLSVSLAGAHSMIQYSIPNFFCISGFHFLFSSLRTLHEHTHASAPSTYLVGSRPNLTVI